MNIDFNITNHCNAKCPTCKRFDADNYLEITPGLNVTHMKFEDFVETIEKNKDFFKGKIAYFCGEFGDPLMHPQIKEFAEIASEVFSELVIYTNGGLSRKDFFNFVSNTTKNIVVRFGIDGLTHEINNLYRINVNTELAFKNMFFLANYGKAVWDFTIFEHNKHEIEGVVQLAKKHNILVNIRCNLRPDFHHVKRITRKDYDDFICMMKKYDSDDMVHYDDFWVDQ